MLTRCGTLVTILFCCLLAMNGSVAVAFSPPLPTMHCEIHRPLMLKQPPITGDDVKALQTALEQHGFYQGTIDGIFGSATEQSLIRFQMTHNLTVNGIADDRVWHALYADADPFYVPTSDIPAPEGKLFIEVDIRTLRLTVFSDGEPYKTYPIAVGRPDRYTLSPIGEWTIIQKGGNWGGGFGTRWLGLNVPWGIYGIHGTNDPSSIGSRASAGCIRMHNRDVEELYEWVSVGTPVTIVGDQPDHIVFDRRLTVGHVDDSVVFVQMQLDKLGFSPQGADGRYGENTADAVRQLQKQYGLPADGTVYEDVYFILGLR